MDILRLRELAVRDGWHHVEWREHFRPGGGAAPLDHLHYVPDRERESKLHVEADTGYSAERKHKDKFLCLTFASSVKPVTSLFALQDAGKPPPTG